MDKIFGEVDAVEAGEYNDEKLDTGIAAAATAVEHREL